MTHLHCHTSQTIPHFWTKDQTSSKHIHLKVKAKDATSHEDNSSVWLQIASFINQSTWETGTIYGKCLCIHLHSTFHPPKTTTETTWHVSNQIMWLSFTIHQSALPNSCANRQPDSLTSLAGRKTWKWPVRLNQPARDNIKLLIMIDFRMTLCLE